MSSVESRVDVYNLIEKTIDFLAERTGDFDPLSVRLVAKGLLSVNQIEECILNNTTVNRNKKMYLILRNNPDCLNDLLECLERTSNGHVAKLLKQEMPSFERSISKISGATTPRAVKRAVLRDDLTQLLRTLKNINAVAMVSFVNNLLEHDSSAINNAKSSATIHGTMDYGIFVEKAIDNWRQSQGSRATFQALLTVLAEEDLTSIKEEIQSKFDIANY